MDSQKNPLGWPTWLWRCLLVLMLAMAAYTVTGSLTNFARAGGLQRDLPDPGFTAEQQLGASPGLVRLQSVESGGPADKAGLRRGDLSRSTPGRIGGLSPR